MKLKSMYKLILCILLIVCIFFFGTKEGMLVTKIILFTSSDCKEKECKELNVVWQELYNVYGNKLSTIDCRKPLSTIASKAMKQYNIKKIPTIIGIQNNQVTYYDANDKNDSLKGFIALQIGPPPPPERLGQNHQRTIRNKNII